MSYDNTTALMQALSHGTREAQEYFLRQYAPHVFISIVRLVGNATDAEELTQDIMLSAMQHSCDYDERRASLTTWLDRMAHNAAMNHLRTSRRLNLVPIDELPRADISEAEIDSTLDTEDIDLLQQAINHLPPDAQALIWLFYRDNRSLSDIAFITGRAPNAIATQLHRLRRRLYTIILRLKDRQQ